MPSAPDPGPGFFDSYAVLYGSSKGAQVRNKSDISSVVKRKDWSFPSIAGLAYEKRVPYRVGLGQKYLAKP